MLNSSLSYAIIEANHELVDSTKSNIAKIKYELGKLESQKNLLNAILTNTDNKKDVRIIKSHMVIINELNTELDSLLIVYELMLNLPNLESAKNYAISHWPLVNTITDKMIQLETKIAKLVEQYSDETRISLNSLNFTTEKPQSRHFQNIVNYVLTPVLVYGITKKLYSTVKNLFKLPKEDQEQAVAPKSKRSKKRVPPKLPPAYFDNGEGSGANAAHEAGNLAKQTPDQQLQQMAREHLRARTTASAVETTFAEQIEAALKVENKVEILRLAKRLTTEMMTTLDQETLVQLERFLRENGSKAGIAAIQKIVDFRESH